MKAVALSPGGIQVYFVPGVGFAALLLALWLKVVARLRDFAETRTGNRWLQAVIFVPALLGCGAAASASAGVRTHIGGALRAVGARMGLVAVGLDQGELLSIGCDRGWRGCCLQ